jgi:N-acetyl-anhydromuramyl-L-alanine amidase AmpD
MKRYASFIFCLSAVSFQAHTSEIIDMPSENCCERSVAGAPKYLVMHTVGFGEDWVVPNFTKSTANGGLGVSSHYYITSSGDKTIRFVDPTKVAYHAGVSEWQGDAAKHGLKGLNHMSVGIEVGCAGTFLVKGDAYYPYSFPAYSEASIAKAIELSSATMKQFGILPQNVVWHSDISPFVVTDKGVAIRKSDPGAAFPGKLLASHDIGVWPVEDRISDEPLSYTMENLNAALLKIGFGFDPLDKMQSLYTAQAFIMHYAPQEVKWGYHAEQKDSLAWDGTITENIMIRAANLASGAMVEFK